MTYPFDALILLAVRQLSPLQVWRHLGYVMGFRSPCRNSVMGHPAHSIKQLPSAHAKEWKLMMAAMENEVNNLRAGVVVHRRGDPQNPAWLSRFAHTC